MALNVALTKFVLLCFSFDNFSLLAAMTRLWLLSILVPEYALQSLMWSL